MINKDFKVMGIMGLVNDDEEEAWVNVYLKEGGTHRCKLSEAWEYSRQNPDKVETRTRKQRRTQHD